MDPRRTLSFALALIFCAALPALAVAQNGEQSDEPPAIPEFFEGVRASGAGGSHTAVASGVDSIYQNPAGTARARMYVLDGAFSYTPQGALLTTGVVDSKLNPQLSAGFGYSYFIGRGDHEHLSGHDFRGALAIPVVHEQISVGAGVRYLRITDDRLPDIDEDDDQLLIHGVTIDAGVNFRAAEILHLGLKGENLIDHCADDPQCRGATPTRITGGLGLGEETSFMFSGEAGVDLTSDPEGPRFDAGVGVEYLVAGTVPLRAGFQRRDYVGRNLLTFGVGWHSEEVGVDASYRHDLSDAGQFGYASASFSVYF